MFTVYGIPNCDTVKKARRWLDDQGVEATFVDFRAQPVGAERVRTWVDTLGVKALKNTSGGSYRALPEAKADWDAAEWAEAFTRDPMLLKRPVIEAAGKPVQAGFRTTEALEALLP